ncbi:AlkA N-terminal domain-containing protein [Marinicella meishanensis]|uniref:AlkA N-terminal domain-containing protein n=1 Tax=Marinicella meishanensis TaxID=2873263 RepID=UPI001CBDCD27|nr:AlkA N-terminal domain-containing protein [Marinicella sp. NBU2979]
MAGASRRLFYNGGSFSPDDHPVLSQEVCRKARLSRDARFDGRFFTAVKTTGIYCRSICPATPPKETNVDYYATAHQAAAAGYRPCLRCRPDSAPNSAAWLGSQALLQRALRLLNAGALEHQTLSEFAQYLGVSDRYLRQLFVQHLGTAPKAYVLYQQCLMAKQLLHQTQLPINQIALACGFNSVRRFNDCFKQTIQLTPTAIRQAKPSTHNELMLKLSYRPPYNWSQVHDFLAARLIPGLEQLTANRYGRTFDWPGGRGAFTATHQADQHAFVVKLQLSDISQLRWVINNIRRVLDLDADTAVIEAHLTEHLPTDFSLTHGLRIPGIWSVFEAGIRAILGQQISVTAAKNLVIQLVDQLGHQAGGQRWFPRPEDIAANDLAWLKMPGARKQTLRNLASHFVAQKEAADPDTWLAIKGVGPWTVNYAKLRGLSEPDVFLAGDLGVDKALQGHPIEPADLAPWRSYFTFQLWSQT